MSLTTDSSLPSGRRDIPKDGEDEEEPIVTRQNEREWHVGCQEIAQRRRRGFNQNCVGYHYCCARTPPSFSWFLMASVTRMRAPISSSSAPTVIFIHRLRSSHKIRMRWGRKDPQWSFVAMNHCQRRLTMVTFNHNLDRWCSIFFFFMFSVDAFKISKLFPDYNQSLLHRSSVSGDSHDTQH